MSLNCEVKFYLSPRISNQNLAQRQIPQYRLFSLFIAPKVTAPAFDLLNLARFLRYFHIRCLRRYASNPEILAKDCASASRIASVKKGRLSQILLFSDNDYRLNLKIFILQSYCFIAAIASISTRPPFGRVFTATVLRAGYGCLK